MFAFLLLARAEPVPAALLALFGGVFTLRWFARCFAYVKGSMHRAVASDLDLCAGADRGPGRVWR